jgi:integrase
MWRNNPHHLIKHMTGKFTVNQLSNPHGNCNWRMEGKIDGKRIRAFYRTKLEAEEAARRRNIEVADHGHKHADIPASLRVEAMRAQEQLDRIGASLTEAVAFYLRHHDLRTNSLTVAEVFTRLNEHHLRKVEAQDITNRHVETWRVNARKFVLEFGASHICDINNCQISEWLNRLPVATRTKNTVRRSVGRLFYFSEECGWLRDNPMRKVQAIKQKNTKLPGILSVQEAATLLATAPEVLVAPIAIGLFAGIRPVEILRLDWSDILWHKRQINVAASKAKTATVRWVDMTDPLIEWLTPHRKASGPIFPMSEGKASQAITAASKAAGMTSWPKDGLRHSFGSYHLAAHDNAALTARQMGHASTDMVYSNYNNRRTREEGIAFFNIRPQVAQNIVAIA